MGFRPHSWVVRCYCKIVADPLYKNSIYISLSRIFDIGFGVLFWIIAARIYSIDDVGVATALVSMLLLIVTFSRMGFDLTLIRFRQKYGQETVINTSLALTSILSVLIGLVLFMIVQYFFPSIHFFYGINYWLFIFVILGCSITFTMGYAFLAIKEAKFRVIQNLLMGIRILFLFFLLAYGAAGIFLSIGFAYILVAIWAIVLLRRLMILNLQIDRNFIKDTLKFNSGNYVSTLLNTAPAIFLPLLIISVLSESDAALFYIAFSIGNVISVIPDAINLSFFVEGSNGTCLRKKAVSSLKGIVIMVIPAVIVVSIFAKEILSIFGAQYTSASEILVLLSISMIAITIYNLFIPLQYIRMEIRSVICTTFIRMVLILVFCYCLMLQFGLVGVGLGWLVAHIVMLIGIAVIARSKKWI